MLEHAMIMSSGKTLVVQAPKFTSPEASDAPHLEDMERRHIVSVLEKNGWRVGGKGGAAEVLGSEEIDLIFEDEEVGY